VAGCKLSTKGTTESFRAPRKGWRIFGKEHTAFLLHQIVPDCAAANSHPNSPEPLIKNNRMSELFDMAPTPVTEYAVPYGQLILAIEKVPNALLDYAMCTAGVQAVGMVQGAARAVPTGGVSTVLATPLFGLTVGPSGQRMCLPLGPCRLACGNRTR
jgi:hypothetical protein